MALPTAVLLLACALAAASALPARRIGWNSATDRLKIVNGTMADIEEIPYQLSFEQLYIHNCGASIVSESFAVTAAHCVVGIPVFMMRVRAGSTWTFIGNWMGSTSGVKRAAYHPTFSMQTMDNDVAVLEFKRSIKAGPAIQPIALPLSEEALPQGATGVVSGWGTLHEGGLLTAYHLRRLTIPLWSGEECNALYVNPMSKVTDTMLCGGNFNGDSCQGDSGGPLVSEGKLVGIVSWGEGCNEQGKPGIYTRVAAKSVRQFIEKQTGL